MVQVKKDEIKQVIENSALDLFLEKGYINTKINDIAQNSSISVGNIYIYFKSKEELFYTILPQSFVDSLKSYNSNIFPILSIAFLKYHKRLERYLPTNRRIDSIILNRKKILILLRYSKGTKYENIKEEIIENIINSEINFLQKNGFVNIYNKNQNYRIAKMVFNNMLNLLLDSLEGDITDDERRKVIKFTYEYNLVGFKMFLEEYIK